MTHEGRIADELTQQMDPGATSLAGCAAGTGGGAGLIGSAAAGGSELPSRIGLAALLTLLSLLVTGVYLFAQHYLRKIRRARSESAS